MSKGKDLINSIKYGLYRMLTKNIRTYLLPEYMTGSGNVIRTSLKYAARPYLTLSDALGKNTASERVRTAGFIGIMRNSRTHLTGNMHRLISVRNGYLPETEVT